jgi:hypothetical protein
MPCSNFAIARSSSAAAIWPPMPSPTATPAKRPSQRRQPFSCRPLASMAMSNARNTTPIIAIMNGSCSIEPL